MIKYCLRKLPLIAFTLFFTVATINPVHGNNAPQTLTPSTVSQAPQPKAKLKLYGGPQTRTPIIQWYLEELNIPYEYISLDIRGKENQQPAYLAINPMGKVPAIVDGDFKLWESGAILLYLAEKNGKMPDSLEQRATITEWVIFANATLSPGLFLPDKRQEEMPRLLTPINQILQTKPFLLGDNLTVADVAVASYLYYAQKMLSLDYSNYPALVKYLDRMAERPAFKNTLGKRFQNNQSK